MKQPDQAPDITRYRAVTVVCAHPDDERATEAAVTAAEQLGVPVSGWELSDGVAAALRDQFDIPFVGRDVHDPTPSQPLTPPEEIDT